MLYEERYPDLANILGKGINPAKLDEAVMWIGMLRIPEVSLMRGINFQTGTKQKIYALAELKYLGIIDYPGIGELCFLTDKGIKYLIERGANESAIMKPDPSKLTEHSILTAKIIAGLKKDEPIRAVFYPSFRSETGGKHWLIPDAAFISATTAKDKKTSSKTIINSYKITFLEVENEKGNWDEYIAEKERKYRELGRRAELYSRWWMKWAGVFGLPMCREEDFCFSVIYEKTPRGVNCER